MQDIITKTISRQKIFGLRITSGFKIFIFLIPLFFVPFLLGGPQLLVGSIVNLLLIFIARKYKKYSAIIPMVMLPSIATVARGLVFGPFTIFLVYLMPAIRIGNFLLVYIIQRVKTKRVGIFFGGVCKAVFLFVVAYILVYLGMLPVIFLKAMGIFQFITAMIAGIAAIGFIRLSK